MNKSNNFQNDILVEGYMLNQDKDGDGRKRAVEFIVDPDYNKETIERLESRDSCYLLKYDDRWNNYYWNSAGCYFCNDSCL